jgi:hypothetical protein
VQKAPTEPLLCQPCDNRIGRWETYAAAVLRRAEEAAANSGRAIRLRDVDLRVFRLFGLSLLWRAHIARGHVFTPVSLGPHGDRIREMLRADEPGEPSQYGFVLMKVVEVENPSQIFMGPALLPRLKGHRAYHWMAGGYEWGFFVSSHSGELTGHAPFVGQDEELIIPFLPVNQSKLYAKIRKAFPNVFGK